MEWAGIFQCSHRTHPINILLNLTFFTSMTVVATLVQQPTTQEEVVPNNITRGTNKFAIILYQALATEKKGNVFVSPLSAQIVLALAYTGARGQTAKELATLLDLSDNIENTYAGYQTLITVLQTPVLQMANRLFVENTTGIKEDFQMNAKKFFQSPAAALDFYSASDKSREKINSWVETHTNKKITNLLKPGDITSNTKLVLVNAIHFKDDWNVKFLEANTKEEPFRVSKTKTVQVKMMHITSQFVLAHDEELKAKILTLDYKDRKNRMIIILPDDIDGLVELEAKIEQVNLFEKISYGQIFNVTVAMPKFQMEETMDLKNILKSLGAKVMFDDNADFSGLSHEPLKVSKVVQKAFVEINEKGTEAAAATAVDFGTKTHQIKPIDATFIADHPFMFIITTQDQTLFVGRLVEPPNN